jgi:hypothetical protein
MPKSIKAPIPGNCGRCGLPYGAGSSVTYSLSKPGERYHFPSCGITSGPAHRATTPSTSVPDPFASAFAEPVAPKMGESVKASQITNRSKWWEILEACLDSGLNRILLVGPPGTGKSTTADRDGLRVTCHEDAGPESMVGTFIQKDGNTVWIDGPAVCAMKQGTRIVLDEADHSSPECVSLLYALLDDAPSIMLPTGEQVKASKGYQVIGTSNSSPSDFPEAILDRFEAVIVASNPHPEAVKSVGLMVPIMTNYYSGLDKKPYQFKGSPTLRKCRNFSKLVDAGMNHEIAATCVFGSAGKEILSAMTTAGVKL